MWRRMTRLHVQGGCGTVWLARDSDGRLCALKKMAEDADFHHCNERGASCRLQYPGGHKNVLPYCGRVEASEPGALGHIVFDYAPGGDLDAWAA